MIPVTGSGRTLQRIALKAVLPVAGVGEGVVLSAEERAAIAAMQASRRAGVGTGEAQPLGIMQYLHFTVSNTNPGLVLGDPVDSEHIIGVAPFDGWMREVLLDGTLSGATLPSVAIRTSSGGTWFRSFEDGQFPITTEFLEPDFGRLNFPFPTGQRVELRGGKVPVYAGDQILVTLRDQNATPAGVLFVAGYIGFESVVLARPGTQAATSQFLALNTAAINAARDQASNAGRLALEREKTKRAALEAEARVKVAQLALETKRAASVPMANPFNRVAVSQRGQQLQQARQPVTVPQPAFGSEAPPSTSGKGKTFVSAWMPNQNSIGYLIPDPPPGGKVNVFGDTYTIWSASGQNLGQGKVELVRNESEIPAESRVSRNLGVSLSPEIKAQQQAILTTRAGGSAFG